MPIASVSVSFRSNLRKKTCQTLDANFQIPEQEKRWRYPLQYSSGYSNIWKAFSHRGVWYCLYEPLSLHRVSSSSRLSAVARQKDKRIKGIMVVRKDSPLTELAELNDHKLAFPSPAAFAASVVPRAKMELQGGCSLRLSTYLHMIPCILVLRVVSFLLVVGLCVPLIIRRLKSETSCAYYGLLRPILRMHSSSPAC